MREDRYICDTDGEGSFWGFALESPVQQAVGKVISRIENEHTQQLKEYQEVQSLTKLKEDVKVMHETTWSGEHYDKYYHLTPEDIAEGKIRLDAYTVAKVWKIGSKDDSGALFHTFKLFPRWGEKNTVEREIVALYNQAKALARVYNVKLENK